MGIIMPKADEETTKKEAARADKRNASLNEPKARSSVSTQTTATQSRATAARSTSLTSLRPTNEAALAVKKSITPIIKAVSFLKQTLEKQKEEIRGLSSAYRQEGEELSLCLQAIANDMSTTINSCDNFTAKCQREGKSFDFLSNIGLKTIKSSLFIFAQRLVEIADFFSTETDSLDLLNQYVGELLATATHCQNMISEDDDEEELEELYTEKEMLKQYIDTQLQMLSNPSRPFFSQSMAEGKFSSTPNTRTASVTLLGKSVLDVATEIQEDPIRSQDICCCVQFYQKGNYWIGKNNRSLAAAAVSGIKPRLTVIFPETEVESYLEQKLREEGTQTRSPKMEANRSAFKKFEPVLTKNQIILEMPTGNNPVIEMPIRLHSPFEVIKQQHEQWHTSTFSDQRRSSSSSGDSVDATSSDSATTTPTMQPRRSQFSTPLTFFGGKASKKQPEEDNPSPPLPTPKSPKGYS